MRASLVAAVVVAACSGPSRPPAGQQPAPAPPDAGVAALPPTGGPPVARVDEVRETIHGVEVVDPYRWMEAGGDELTAYLEAQDTYARGVLAALPDRDALGQALEAADRGVTRVAIAAVRPGPRIFTLRRASDAEQPSLFWRDGWRGEDVLLVAPGDGESIDYAVPCPRGKYVAYGVSSRGAEDATLRVLEVDNGKVLAGAISRVVLPDVSWRPDGVSFFYNRLADHPRETRVEESEVFLYALADGVEIDETPVLGVSQARHGFAPLDFPYVNVSPGSPWVLGGVQSGTEVGLEILVAKLDDVEPGEDPWRRIADVDDDVVEAFTRGSDVYLRTFAGAPRFRVIKLGAAKGTLASAVEVVAEGDALLEQMVPAKDGLYLQYQRGGVHSLERVSWDGKKRTSVKLPFDGAIRKLAGRLDVDGVTFQLEGWTHAPITLRATSKGVVDLGLVEPWPDDHRDLLSERVEVVSEDGTRVPLSIIRRADAPRDGTTPAILVGYGAYGSPFEPEHDPLDLAWVQRGGVMAFCHVRGGGEYGEPWHAAGIKLNKERGVEDFLACAEHLIAAKLTSSSRLTAAGTSAGGILVGGAITREPERFAAAVLRVPAVNLTRIEQSAVGRGNVTEMGTLADPSEARAMVASDPYLRVVDGAAYPAVMLTTGLNDPRVPPWQPAKLAARLQAASSSGKPVLLRVERDAGHGKGSARSLVRAEWADIFAFALAASAE